MLKKKKKKKNAKVCLVVFKSQDLIKMPNQHLFFLNDYSL